MKCNNCKNDILVHAKFCGKCGYKISGVNSKIEEDTVILEGIPKENTEQGELENKVKNVGSFAVGVGFLNIIGGIILFFIVLFGNNTGLLNDYRFSDCVLNIIDGLIFILIGSRINGGVNNKTKRYLWLLVAISSLIVFINIGIGAKPILSGLLLIYSIVGLLKVKNLESLKKVAPSYFITGWKLLLTVLVLILVLIIAISADTIKSGTTKDPAELPIDKGSTYSEVTGNMYRNTKYHFRIKFPEGWEIKNGDGIHIIQKAVSGNSSISIWLKQIDLSGATISSIKDIGSTKEIIDIALESEKIKSADLKVINYGDTKIDNSPAYWVEYSMVYEVLDKKLKMTSVSYILAKGNTLYLITAGTASEEYVQLKPIFYKSISTFVLEQY